MPECTTTYEKLLEAQNEQLREKIEKLIAENDELNKKAATVQIQFNLLYKDVTEFFKRSKIHIVNHPAFRRRKASQEAVFTSSWTPDGGYSETNMPILHPILRQIWLDFLQSSVEGMRWAYKSEGEKRSYTYFQKHGVTFKASNTEQPEANKP